MLEGRHRASGIRVSEHTSRHVFHPNRPGFGEEAWLLYVLPEKALGRVDV